MNSSISLAALRLHEKLTGRRILERLDELNRTQWLSRNELLALQRAKLQRLVEYAYQYVPYYRRTFDEAGFHPDGLRKDLAHLAKLPVLTKSIIRKNYQDMLTTEPERRGRMSKLNTSGSTGEPLVFMQDNNFRDFVTADIQRHLGWVGWNPGDIHAYIWGAPIRPTLRKKMRTWMINRIWSRFQIDAFSLDEAVMTSFAQRLSRQKAKILFGYATSVYEFARFIRRSPFQDITLDGLITTSELLLSSVRHYIEETFRCKVFNRYGTLELGGVACECETHSGLHVSVENNYVEILHDSSPVAPGEVGDLIVTNLNNLGMPFIRYSIGDAGAWHIEGDDCPCGRASPKLSAIEGRLVDSFQTRDGRKVWSGFAGAGFRCLTHPTIGQFQVVQKSLDKMIVRLVQDGIIPHPVLDEISQAIRTAYGDNVEVAFEFPEEIPPLPSGKHQYAMSELNKP